MDRTKRLLRAIGFYRELSLALYRSSSGANRGRFACGADAVDGERHRLVAAALTQVLHGASVAIAVAWFRAEWDSFAAVQNARVEAAPRLRHGPMAGCSSSHYLWASECSGEQGEISIRHACREAGGQP